MKTQEMIKLFKGKFAIFAIAIPYAMISLMGMAIGILIAPLIVGIREGYKMAEDIGETAMELAAIIYHKKYKPEEPK